MNAVIIYLMLVFQPVDDRYEWMFDEPSQSWILLDAPCASGAWDPNLQECVDCEFARAEGWIVEDDKCQD